MLGLPENVHDQRTLHRIGHDHCHLGGSGVVVGALVPDGIVKMRVGQPKRRRLRVHHGNKRLLALRDLIYDDHGAVCCRFHTDSKEQVADQKLISNVMSRNACSCIGPRACIVPRLLGDGEFAFKVRDLEIFAGNDQRHNLGE